MVNKSLTKWLAEYVNKLQRQYGKHHLLGTSVVIILLLFADSLLPIFGHALILIWHMAEAVIEHFLEKLFGISHWHADFATFWICTSGVSFITWRISKKCYQSAKCVCHTYKCRWQSKSKGTRCAIIAAVTAVFVVTNL